MHSPSPQLLRALRTSLSSAPSPLSLRGSASRFSHAIPSSNGLRCASVNASFSIPSTFRNNSSVSRPSRLVSRSHTLKPTSPDRGPESEEDTQTDFDTLDVLANAAAPAAAIDATLDTGFDLSNGVRIRNGDALLLIGGEPFAWRPWKAIKGVANDQAAKAAMVNAKGQFELPEEVWGLLSVVWPRPDMLILGLGDTAMPLSPETKRHINALGIRVEIQDTRNAAGQFNLLATERGVEEVAAAMIPTGWKPRK
ncbi:hypothetical protein N7509_009293 [Penicillium cosmopolitanum]|uniref:NADH dehydrogenase [ubiquinone] 1 alpha subcomplex assembly factor 3 n=1 Tax=Penicillium cosmopolitanum TaxID=1131564 RepID=A0A9X0B3I1_9EURO|nr:uncharacterized protein N7509_009293 [Penicillium cosmopolitanum]KAJ5386752.1 hypothetical protein N7509_009293 [Penicillium cosmopolitanum]